jgi:hypothetical protein
VLVIIRLLVQLLMMMAFAVASAAPAHAQTPSQVGFSAAGLVSIQPVDPAYVGPSGPYLNRGLGGLGPGLAIGLDVVAERVALVFEYSTAWFNVPQQGRLVNGGAGTGHLRDSMVTALVGAQLGRGRTRTRLLGGGSYLMGTPSSNGVPRTDSDDAPFRGALSFGADVVTAVGPRASVVVTARAYPWIDRSESARQLGVGRHVFRAGVGVRLALSER